jgi:hypothetical protein
MAIGAPNEGLKIPITLERQRNNVLGFKDI